MKNLLVGYFLAFCMVLSGCAGNQQRAQKTGPLEQEDTRQEVQDGASADPSQAKELESSAGPDFARKMMYSLGDDYVLLL